MQKLFTKTKGLLLLSAALLAACQPDSDVSPDNTPNVRPLTAQESQTVGSANDFAFRSFAALRKSEAANNLFISPLSISAALTMTYNGADGTTKEAMRKTLGYAPTATDEEISQSYKSLFALLQGVDQKVSFAAANSLWHAQQYKLQAPFVQLNQTYFDAKVQGVNFAESSTKNTINDWVESKTNGRIKDLIKQTTSDDALYLVNALYFKGTWTYTFDKKQTKSAPFYLEDGSTISRDFMALTKGRYLYAADADMQLIDLPYGNRQYSLTLLQPTATHTLADLTATLSSAKLAACLSRADTMSLPLHLPKFKLEYEVDLKEVLTQLGMDEAFGDRANFSKMLEGRSNLAIGKVLHKTFVEVDEEGTEAAAATAVGMVNNSIGSPTELWINRPFLFIIREKSSNAILFIGQLMK
ncbi:serpin family protein [Hymenobacter profundi]|uniref:Serpin family protein n=1 Tax=Hymenobacter profundi TaxID=1982110 RepID=A0ABS6X2I8_9BACT|nr:serpin family protein [Hymenobacter profundi]MBW3130050.1 serpin family protein [Hymenobacter profundi]